MSKEKKLMVVDDEEEICNFVKMFFEARGITVQQANNGEEAIELAKTYQPHVVLLDVNMGDGDDGVTVLPKILAVSENSRVLMTTGVDDEIMIAKAKKLGAVDYITKPLVLEDLVANVGKQFEQLNND